MAPIPLLCVLACCSRARSAGAPVCWRGFACPSRFLREQAAGGLEAGPAAAPVPDAAVLPGGGGRPLCRGWGADGPVGGRWWGRLGAACGPPPGPPSVAGASPPCVRIRPGSWGSPRAGCGLPPAGQSGGSGGGGVAWGPGGAGGRSVSVRPSALPGRATKRASLAGLRSRGAWTPQCSGSLSPAAPGRGPCVVLVRWRGLARLSRPQQEQGAAGVGARGVQAQLRPPPGAAAPSGGGGTSLQPQGGWRDGAPLVRRPEGGVGGRGEGGPCRGSPLPCPGGVARGPRPSPPSSPGNPPLVYTFSRGCQVAPGTRRGLVGRRRVSLARGGGGGGCQCAVSPGARPGGSEGWGGGEVSLPRSVPPPTPGGHQGRSLGPRRCCIPGCRRSAAAHGAPLSTGAELLVGSGHCGSEWAADPGHLGRSCAPCGCGVPPLGAPALLGGLRGRRLPGWPLAVRGPGGGGGGRGGGSPPLVPWRRPLAVAGGRPGGSRSRGAGCHRGGAHPSPAPLHPLRARPLCRPSLGPPALLAKGGGESGRVLGAAARVSGQGLAGCRAVGPPVRSLPPPSPLLEVIPPPRRTVGGLAVALPSRSSPGPAGRGRHLRCRLRGGWGCCGGGFRP